ncbi:OmpA family protein [Thiofilum flexile]|uniref:OmpA family protein n=1 Tax=Thiofilum flexile TaxID=125627 RepID=UPI00038103A2|nr:OmpA family protein [Thiofilum flexile]
MKITKRYPFSQWLLLPLLSCSSIVLANELAAGGVPNSVLTLEDNYVETPNTTIRTTTPNAKAQATALANNSNGFLETQTTSTAGGSKSYMGGNTRIGVSVDSQYKLRLDGTQVFSDTKDSVTSGEGWIGFNPKPNEDEDEKALTGAGLKINHNWVGKNDTGGVSRVHKVFGAYDQNEQKDKKVTAGYGQETQNMFWSGQASFAKGDERVVGTSGKTPIIERPYDYGVGGRVGTFLPNQLMQVQGGLDLEFGKTYADNEKRPTQVTVSGGVEKFFMDSPHSIGANIELLNKSGGTEEEKKNDARGSLSYRYEFGGANGLYEPNQMYKRVRVEIPGEVKVVQTPGKKIEQKMVKNTMELEGDTFFARGKWELLPAAKQRLQSIMAQMRNGVKGNIHIVGSTCDLGTAESNKFLSEKRANAVREYFISNGFDPNTLLAEGMGEANPKYPNDEAHRYRNRRVDIEYLTYQNSYKNVVVDETKTTTVRTAPRVVWRQELVKTPPRWVERALRNNIQHKRSIDTYRTGGVAGNTNTSTINVKDDSFSVVLNDTNTKTINVLTNDTGDGLTIINVSTPQYGTAVISKDGKSISYTLRHGYCESHTFTYTVQDKNGNTAQATVYVDVQS